MATLNEGWEVEWCIEIPTDENGESLHDDAKFRYADFTTEEAAMKHAKKVYPKDKYGSVRITRFHTEPWERGIPGGFREYDGEVVYYEGE